MAGEVDPSERVIGQAMNDPVFRKRLLADPVATLRGVGMDVPDGVQVKILENSPTLVHMVLPSPDMGELSDADLDAVAGGARRAATTWWSACSTVTASTCDTDGCFAKG